MSAKPVTLPRWARTAGGVDASNIATPSSGEQDTGWTNGQNPVASTKMNWLFNKLLLWILFLDDSPAFVPTTAGAAGLSATGNGSGAGVVGTGGATGTGGAFTGGATGSHGATGTATGSGNDGLRGVGITTGAGVRGTGGATGVGLVGVGGATSGDGITGTGTAGNSRGGNFTGQGSAEGLLATGGATGPGLKGTAGGGASPVRGALSLAPTTNAPSAPSDGDIWTDGAGVSMVAKVRLNGANFIFASNPFAQADMGTAQSITNATNTTLVYDTENTDTHAAYNPATGVFTVPTGLGGHYAVSAYLLYNVASFANPIEIFVTVNGTTKVRQQWESHTQGRSIQVTGVVLATAGQTIEFKTAQSSGASKLLGTGAVNCSMSIKRISD